MRVDDLLHRQLLELDSEESVIRFAGHRALLLDAVAMGFLRRYLIDNFGLTAARTVLTQFGFAHGWRMAEVLASEFTWESEEDWRRAGTRIHALQGFFRMEVDSLGPLSMEGSVLRASFEAEQHLMHFGRSDVSVCWTVCGLISGYLSRVTGKETYVLEDRCTCMGDAVCHIYARTRTDWGDARAPELRFFERSRLQECLEMSLSDIIEKLRETERKLREHRRKLSRILPAVEAPLGTVARSPAMKRVLDLATRVAKVDTSVLLTGESGVGKERIARLLHDQSARVSGPFVAVNCGAITEALLESELFGHVRGAFTGATHDRAGLFEAATGGTLLLDEVGDVSAGMQVKLLRVLQEREVRRVGENRSRKVDVRVVAATNCNLAQAVEAGTFRKDLYYRLNVVELHIPPLRDRREDLLPLARELLTAAASRMKRRISGLSPTAAEQVLRYAWPGNVRELENAMERAIALASGRRVELEDLPDEVRHAFPVPIATPGTVRPLDEVERDYILAVLELNEGNKVRAAQQLEIGTATLYRKLKAYGVPSSVGA